MELGVNIRHKSYNMNQDVAISAGGVVIRRAEDGAVFVALEQQTGREDWDGDIWFIPKGHVEAAESLEAAARREVAEEAGAHDVRLIQKLGVKQRIGKLSGELKEIHYFLFETDNELLTPSATDKPHRGAWFDLFGDMKIGFGEQEEILEVVRGLVSSEDYTFGV